MRDCMDMQWDFWSLCPESLHQVTILFSDRGIPRGHRSMNGFGSHAYSPINARGERAWVQVPLVKTQQGIQCLDDDEAHADHRSGPGKPPARPLRGHRAPRVPRNGKCTSR